MSGRKADFVTYPGSGMWMMCQDGGVNDMHLYKHIPIESLKGIVHQNGWKVFWIDTGIGAANLLTVRQGRKSASATEVTPRILAQYLK